MVKSAGPGLKVIQGTPEAVLAEPPGKLGATGRSLWDDIVRAYEFSDRASYEMLFQACAAADRGASLRDLIDRDGEVIRTKTGIRDHPALKHELAARAFICRTLARLGLDLEPLHGSVGRPPGALGVS